jgi:hypothetical protein
MLKGDSRDLWSVEEWTRGKVLRGLGPRQRGDHQWRARRRRCEKMPLHPVVADRGISERVRRHTQSDSKVRPPFLQTLKLYTRRTFKKLEKPLAQLTVTARKESSFHSSMHFFASIYASYRFSQMLRMHISDLEILDRLLYNKPSSHGPDSREAQSSLMYREGRACI